MKHFESLDAFRAHCGTPTMPLEDCPICSKIPVSCGRSNIDCDVVDTRTTEVNKLETFVKQEHEPDEHRRGEILRCPTCHRLYLDEIEHVAPTWYFDYEATTQRFDVDALFDTPWCLVQRLGQQLWWVEERMFRTHAIVRLAGGVFAVDHENHVTALDSGSALATLIERDPPCVTGDLELAKRYALFIDRIEDPGARRVNSFDEIVWREPLRDFEQRAIEAARSNYPVAPPTTERAGDAVRVRFWVTDHTLTCRTIMVQPDGRYTRQGAWVQLPVARTTPEYLHSLDAFRSHCGTPSMPLEQCPICSKLPETQRWEGDDPPELALLENLFENTVLRCPTCRRLYDYSSFTGGNDIYRGNEPIYTLSRDTVEALYRSYWGVAQRVPERRVEQVGSRFFPAHALVRFASGSWGALGDTNQLVLLDRRDVIAKLIASDPPDVSDLELAKRYALFIDELERPGDVRMAYFPSYEIAPKTPEEHEQVEQAKSATGLPPDPAMPTSVDTRPTVSREGVRVVVRSWVLSQKRLICRVLTVEPSGHVIAEDAVIAENLPVT